MGAGAECWAQSQLHSHSDDEVLVTALPQECGTGIPACVQQGAPRMLALLNPLAHAHS